MLAIRSALEKGGIFGQVVQGLDVHRLQPGLAPAALVERHAPGPRDDALEAPLLHRAEFVRRPLRRAGQECRADGIVRQGISRGHRSRPSRAAGPPPVRAGCRWRSCAALRRPGRAAGRCSAWCSRSSTRAITSAIVGSLTAAWPRRWALRAELGEVGGSRVIGVAGLP